MLGGGRRMLGGRAGALRRGPETISARWHRNLAAQPDQAEMQTGRRTHAVHASQLSGTEREAAWQKIVAAGPRYAGYVTKTDRLIPVIRLTAA